VDLVAVLELESAQLLLKKQRPLALWWSVLSPPHSMSSAVSEWQERSKDWSRCDERQTLCWCLTTTGLLHYVPHLPLDEAFSIMDQLVAEIVKGIVETITLPSLINLDFADVRAIMANGGVTMMLYGESDRGPQEVVHEALNHPLLDVDISGATGVLIHVTGGPT